jgi:hypothetical protein
MVMGWPSRVFAQADVEKRYGEQAKHHADPEQIFHHRLPGKFEWEKNGRVAGRSGSGRDILIVHPSDEQWPGRHGRKDCSRR